MVRQLEFNPVQSTGDFETDVRNGFYRTNSGQDFFGNFNQFLLRNGVPEKYVSKVGRINPGGVQKLYVRWDTLAMPSRAR